MRWRNVKQNKIPQINAKNANEKQNSIILSPIVWRMKAFLVDIFMLYVPILYVTTYFILGGKEAFLHNQIAILIDNIILSLIIALFWSISGQSPGLKAYEMKLIDLNTGLKPGFLKSMFRWICFLFSATLIFGICLCFFRKDKKNLHDILSKTAVVNV